MDLVGKEFSCISNAIDTTSVWHNLLWLEEEKGIRDLQV